MCMYEANLFVITISLNDRITNNFSDIFVGDMRYGSYTPPPFKKRKSNN